MIMSGALVNTAAILVGGCVGLLMKKGIPERISAAINSGVALCVLYIGISGSLAGEKTLVAILSMVIGAVIGTLLDIDKGLNRLGELAQQKLTKGGDNRFAEGFVSASLLFCIGAMAVVGSLESGLKNDHSTQYAKALLDGISSVVFASTFGPGVLLSALAVLVYQGGITLLAGVLAPVLSDAVIAEMSCVGSLLIVGLSLNMLKVTKLKLANFLPAIFLPILLTRFF